MDAMLIIIAVAMFLLTVVMNVVVMIHFSDEADKNQAWLPKLVVVSSHGVAGAAGGRSCGGWAALGSLGGAGRGGARAVTEAGPFGRRPLWREDPPRRKPGLGGVAFVCAADPSRR